ncbi:MAG: DsbA family oxidoreductase [Chitinophagaceae bacterium]|nr:DsbA family oxidoreductase [Chitinophagaceae bacterium]
MKVEIWSDVVCPFCYIGKRKFEDALSQFRNADDIEIAWKSFQLAPDMKTEPNKNLHQFLAEHKGMSLQQAIIASDQIANIARQVGLVYNFDKAIPANSFDANRFSHLAKHHELHDEAEESLFKAYFTEGRNIDDIPTLILLGREIGLDPTEVKAVLESNRYADEVRQDIYELRQVGVASVPFFVFDGKLSISGAQDSKAFLEALEKTFAEWQNKNAALKPMVTDDNFCKMGEDCK